MTTIMKLNMLLTEALEKGKVRIEDEELAGEFEEFICNWCLYEWKGTWFLIPSSERKEA